LQPTRDPWVRVECAMNVFKERNDGKAFKRLRDMPQDHPIISVGLETLLRNDETDLQLQVALKMVREQVLQVWEEKSNLIDNYKAI
jgi:hypothetical protein